MDSPVSFLSCFDPHCFPVISFQLRRIYVWRKSLDFAHDKVARFDDFKSICGRNVWVILPGDGGNQPKILGEMLFALLGIISMRSVKEAWCRPIFAGYRTAIETIISFTKLNLPIMTSTCLSIFICYV